MAAAGPSVFLLMVSGQVESAQVSGRGPRPPPPLSPEAHAAASRAAVAPDSFRSTTTSTASTPLCTARTGPPRRVWRRASHRSRPRARMCGERWCGTSRSTSPSRARTPTAGRRSCSVYTDQTCLGTTWSEATGQCTCLSHPAGTKGPSPCLSPNPHLNCRSLRAGSWDAGPSTQTPRSWPRVKAEK
ncbi:B9 domain-containing protein 1 isoform X8 [Meles meles]|uniref:B9 domain-containing protein 1 isoform X8 n=1 Tax=Meles meles TaxID=9662 RepID=UPI001E69AC26|nr:B9 domain-containing protein 1 isoform X8 [Meles meles]